MVLSVKCLTPRRPPRLSSASQRSAATGSILRQTPCLFSSTLLHCAPESPESRLLCLVSSPSHPEEEHALPRVRITSAAAAPDCRPLAEPRAAVRAGPSRLTALGSLLTRRFPLGPSRGGHFEASSGGGGGVASLTSAWEFLSIPLTCATSFASAQDSL